MLIYKNESDCEVKTAYMKFDDFNKPLALQVIFVHESDK
jgi:hypothetical protein